MNFLQIAKRVRQEMGASGDGPASVVGQVGHYAKIVAWTQSAHEKVQQACADWGFNWTQDEVALVAGKAVYDPAADWGLDFCSITQDVLHVGRAGEEPAEVRVVPWAEFRLLPLAGASGVPAIASMSPDRKLRLWPAPVNGLVLRLEYQRRPMVLTGNTDVPRIPEELHMAIVWRAVMFGTAHDENGSLHQSARANYRWIMNKMAMRELPQMTIGSLV